MKQFLAGLVIISALAGSVVPVTVFAALCGSSNCESANTFTNDNPSCVCGTTATASAPAPFCKASVDKGGGKTGEVFTTKDACLGAVGGLEKGLEKLTLPVRKAFPATGPGSVEAFIPIINRVGNYVFTFFMVAALILIVMSALQFITGGGDPKQVGEARQKMLWAFVGIGFALLAAFFDNIIASFLDINAK
ncbi:MAG: hypothetical protein HYV78_01445 [Candidatus Wildermuthbacteria bacterium]|nr:hypothetical protein [Candidatus Wildermuthbacteria bacterium]